MTIFTLYNQVYIHIGYMISNVDLFQIWRIAVKMLNFSKDRGQIPTSKENRSGLFYDVCGVERTFNFPSNFNDISLDPHSGSKSSFVVFRNRRFQLIFLV